MSPPPRLLVPAYRHPSDDPALWQRLVEVAPLLRAVVVNPHDGPGAEPDPAYAPVVAALHAAGVRTAGYVDTAYGERSPAEVAADAAVHVGRDGVRGVFLDQVSSGLDRLEHYAQVVRQVRAVGAGPVVLNHGTAPHPGYVDLANLSVVFEGPEQAYAELVEPAWAARFPATRLAHLVHGVAPHRLGEVVGLARRRRAGALMVTDGLGANPWDRLPEQVLAAVGPDPAPAVAPAPRTAAGPPRWRRPFGSGRQQGAEVARVVGG